jgi:predicted HD superfamily hydrolase involved in NAD metabolism
MDYTKIENCKKWLEANLNEERYRHSLGTAECAKKLAKKYGLDEDKAYYCGLIHDCAKCIPNADLKEMICRCEDLCDGELENTKTYHAPAGAILAKKEFGVYDEEILSAIRWHTLGKPNMTTFEKIIFLADKIEEETRPDEWTAPVKAVLNEENGLDKAILICYGNTIKSLVDRNLKICKTTIDVYNDILKSLKL